MLRPAGLALSSCFFKLAFTVPDNKLPALASGSFVGSYNLCRCCGLDPTELNLNSYQLRPLYAGAPLPVVSRTHMYHARAPFARWVQVAPTQLLNVCGVGQRLTL